MQSTNHTKSRKFADLLDNQFQIPGTSIRFGIDPILGLLSGLGDLAGASLSIYFMIYATTQGASSSVLIRMFINILADLTIGAIPILGDIFDIAWKANLRNARLLEDLSEDPNQLQTESSILNWGLLIVLVSVLIGVTIGMIWLLSVVFNRLFG